MRLSRIKERLTEIKTGIEEILQLSDDDIINNIDQDIDVVASDVNSLHTQFVDIHRQMFDPDGEYYMRENKKNNLSMFSQILKEEAEKRKPIDSYELDKKIDKAADALLKLYGELREHGVDLSKIREIYQWLKKQTPVTITTAPQMTEDVKIHTDAQDSDKEEAVKLAQKTKQDVKLVTEASGDEKRYRVILNGYLWANDNKQAVALAEQYKNELDQKQDGKFKTEVFDFESEEKIYPLRETLTELNKKEALALLKENKKRKVKEIKTKAEFLKEIRK